MKNDTICGQPADSKDAEQYDQDGDGLLDRASADCVAHHGDSELDCDDTDASVGGLSTLYQDYDGDGFGGEESLLSCPEEGLVDNSRDCNDENASIHPEATEQCNDIDDNCNEQVDESIGTTWYRDVDADGYGDPDNTYEDCQKVSGTVADSTDCDDSRADVNPGAEEVCGDGVDNNCDGAGCHITDTVQTLQMGDAAVRIDGAQAEGWAGSEVDAADLNGDGRSDILLSSYGFTQGKAEQGAVHVFPGPLSSSLTTEQASLTVLGSGDDSHLGHQIVPVPDQTGDGVEEFLLVGYRYGSDTTGSMHLVDLAALLGGDDTVLVGDVAEAEWFGTTAQGFPWQVRTAEHLFGASAPVILAGAVYDSTVSSHAGGVYVFGMPDSGGLQSASDHEAFFYGEAGTYAGSSLAAADTIGDGHDALFIGAAQYEGPNCDSMSKCGIVHHFSDAAVGNAAMISLDDADSFLYGSHDGVRGDRVGDRIYAAQDAVGEDGREDLLITGSQWEQARSGGPGFVCLVSGEKASTTQDFDDACAVRFEGSADAEQDIGWANHVLGDINGDGHVDIAIGATRPSGLEKSPSTIFVVLGPFVDDGSIFDLGDADLTILGPHAGDNANRIIADHDFDGDSINDLLVGGPWITNGAGERAGAMVLFPGSGF